jgi:hypothetical protein
LAHSGRSTPSTIMLALELFSSDMAIDSEVGDPFHPAPAIGEKA